MHCRSVCALPLTENYKVYILVDLHPLGVKSVLNEGFLVTDALFVSYSTLNYTMTLKLAFSVAQGHRKWRYLIQHIPFYIHLL